MISPDWLFTDPVPTRAKGWIPRAGGGVKLRQAFLANEYGAGQDEPPARDDWMSDSGTAGVAPPPLPGGDGSTDEAGVSAAPPTSPSPQTWPSIDAQPLPNAPADAAPKPQPLPNAPATPDWQSSVSPMGEVGRHDHSQESPEQVNQIPPAGAQLSGDGQWLTTAETQLGRTYVWGGKDPKTGFDCSGYAAWVLQQQGRPYIGASTMTMYPNTDPVSDPQPGDLVFYNMNDPDPHMQHVAVYIGNGKIIQSGGTQNSININSANQAVGSPPEFRRPKGAGPLASTGVSSPSPQQPQTSAPTQQAVSIQQPQQSQQQGPEIPTDSQPTQWFSYVDSGQEVMKITWDNGQTTYHVLGPAESHAEDPGTVLNTGSLGAGQDEESGGQGDDQTEWPIPTTDPSGSVPTPTPVLAPQTPARDDWASPSNTSGPPTPTGSTPPAPSTDSVDSGPSAGTPSSDSNQTEWQVPQPASSSSPDTTTSNANTSTPSTSPSDQPQSSTDSQTEWKLPSPGDVISGVSGAVSGAAQAITQKASELVAAPAGPVPGASQPTPSDQLTNPVAYASANQTKPEEVLPDITQSTLQAPDPSSPLGKMVAGTASPTEQIAAVPELVGRQTEATTEAATQLNPARDVPVVGGLIEQSAAPENWFPVERVAGPVAGAVKKFLPEAVGAAADHLWDPLTHTFQDSWNKLMPDAVTSAVPANAAGRYAAEAGVGAAAGGATYALDDPNDPNRVAKAVAVGTAGLVGAHVAASVTPAIVDALKDTFAPVENLKNPAVRDAVHTRGYRMEASRGENWLWQNRIHDAFGMPGRGYNTLDTLRYIEENGTHVPGMNAQQQQLVQDMLKYVQDTGDEGRRLGYIRGDITTRPDSRGVTLKAYMPRVMKDNLNAANQAPGVWHGRLNPNDNYTHMRQYVSIADGIAGGLNYENSISKAFGHYAEHVNASRANSLFIKELKKSAPDAVQRIRSVKNTPQGWIPGIKYARQWQNVAFAPELDTVLRNLTEPGIQNKLFKGVMNMQAAAKQALFAPSFFHLGNEIRQVYNAAGRDGLSILPKTALFMIPGVGVSAGRKFWANPSVIQAAREAMNDGVVLMRRMPDVGDAGWSGIKNRGAQAAWGAATAGAAGYMDARFDSTLTEEERIQRGLEAAGIGAAGGLLGGSISHQLWSDVVPYMKLMTHQILKPKYGGEAAASFVNSVYGGQNLEAIARSRKVQDALRMVTLAPDWQEGWIRQIGNAILPFNGPINQANRAYWTRAALTSAFMLEGLNTALNGHPTVGIPGTQSFDILGKHIDPTQGNSPGHEFTLETTGLYDKLGWDHTDTQTGEQYRTYVDLLGPYRGLLNAPLNPGSFLSARTGLLPQEMNTAITGKDWRGKDIAPPGADALTQFALRSAYAMSRLAPVGPAELIRTTSQSTNEPLPLQAGLAVAGLRETRQSPLQQAVQQRDQTYRDIGVSVDQEQQLNTTYTGLINEAESKTAAAFDPSKKHADILTEIQRVDWPSRQDLVKTLEPPDIAADPVKNADWVAKMQGIGAIGTQSTQASADATENPTLDMNAVSDVYWHPPGKTLDQLAALPADAQDRLREASLVQQALTLGVDPNALRDRMKASARGEELPPMPGVQSAQLDDWANQYRSITDPDPQVQAQKRRDFIDQTAAGHNLDPQTVYDRIKIRNLPLVKEDPNEPGISATEKQKREMQTSYERAQDALFNSRDPTQYPRYANPDGTAYKGSTPDQWAQWDQQIAAETKSGSRQKHTPEVQALIDARDQATAAREKGLLKDKAGTDYQRWYGVGRNMDESHWQEYVSGKGKQFTDIQDPTENRRRTRTLELWKASTPQERLNTKVKIKVVVGGQVREEVTSLDQAKKHIERAVDPAWKTDMGLDTTGATP